MSIDLTRLRVFRAVLASGTVQAAAQHLGYSPSAVSQQLAALQRETGLTLLEKSGRGLAPTAAGQVLAQRSDEVMGALSRLETLAADLRDGRTGNVVIATVASVGESWIPKIAHTMREEFPEVVLTVDLNEHPMDASIQPDVDVCTEHPEQAIVPRAGYRRVSIHTEPYVLVVPKTHRFAAEPQVAMSQLRGRTSHRRQPGANHVWIDLANRVPGQRHHPALRRPHRRSPWRPRLRWGRCGAFHRAAAGTGRRARFGCPRTFVRACCAAPHRGLCARRQRLQCRSTSSDRVAA
ncbi:MAG: LysR family transcriptional regulator [Marmoricola sp.]